MKRSTLTGWSLAFTVAISLCGGSLRAQTPDAVPEEEPQPAVETVPEPEPTADGETPREMAPPPGMGNSSDSTAAAEGNRDANDRMGADRRSSRPDGAPQPGVRGGQSRGLRGRGQPSNDNSPRSSRWGNDRRGFSAPMANFDRRQDGTNSPAGDAYAAFKLVWERNIFDPNRRPFRPRDPSTERPRRRDVMTLVGTMISELGSYAFFDGNTSDARKVLKPGNEIGTYKIADIAMQGIKVRNGTNMMDLTLGGEITREEGQAWQIARGRGMPVTKVDQPAALPTALSSVEESDIVKRLMQKREQELK